MRKCIISFANSTNNYMRGLARLSESLRNNFDGDFLGFVGEATCGAPAHADNPYAFKIYCWLKAIEAGYTHILWLDSSCFAVAPLDRIFNDIATKGFAVQDSGHWLGHWSNDRALNYFGITRDKAMDIRMIGNAGFLGLDIHSSFGHDFFSKWKRSMDDGIFHGAWTNDNKTESQDERCRGNRHDMTCSSAIFYKMGFGIGDMYGGEEVLQYAGLYDKILNETIVLKAQGL